MRARWWQLLPTREQGESGPKNFVALGGLVAPHLALVEATNILCRLERTKVLKAAQARESASDLLQIEIELVPFQPFAQRVWELRANVTSYDAWYVAIAESFDLPLATMDRRLSRASGPRCHFLLPPDSGSS